MPRDARQLHSVAVFPSPRNARARNLARGARGRIMRSAVARRAILGTPRGAVRRAATVVTGTRASTAAAAARGSPFLAARATVSTSSPRGRRGRSLRAHRIGRRSSDRRGARLATVVAASLPPNKEWPPPDVWSEFRATHSGTWSGYAARFRFDGAPVRSGTGEVAPAPEWRRTRAFSAFAGPATIEDVDSLTIETTYLEDDPGASGGDETRVSTLLAGGQMGKMCVAQGDFASGPVLLPPCEAGATVRFELGFTIRVPEAFDADWGDGEPEPWDVRVARDATPTERVRVAVDVAADPGARRNWRATAFEMFVERKDGSAHDTLLRDELFPPETIPKGEGTGEGPAYLGEDDLASGDFRAVAGATFLTCESLLDDVAFDEYWVETFRAEREAREARGTGARARRPGKARGKVTVKRDGEDAGGAGKRAEAAATASAPRDVSGRAASGETTHDANAATRATPEEEREKKENERATRELAELRALPKPAPRGLVVVPTWAVRARAPFTSAHEYLVGGNSPLVLLPRNTWVLVESVGDELLVEAGAYAGVGGLGFSDFLDDAEDAEGAARAPRRAAARRYERGGRFASAFFVEEREMSKAELEDELEEGEGGKPLTF